MTVLFESIILGVKWGPVLMGSHSQIYNRIFQTKERLNGLL